MSQVCMILVWGWEFTRVGEGDNELPLENASHNGFVHFLYMFGTHSVPVIPTESIIEPSFLTGILVRAHAV